MPNETKAKPTTEAQDAPVEAQDAQQEPSTPDVPAWAKDDPAKAYQEAQKAREEAAKWRTKLREMEEQAAEAKKQAERAKMDELEAAKAELEDYRKKIEEVSAERQRAEWRADLAGKVADPIAALKLLDAEEHVKDGRVDADALLATYPFLAPQSGPAPTTAANGTRAGRALRAEDVAKMTPEQINERWDEVQAALKR